MLMPPVSRYMSAKPYAVSPRDKLSSARRIMTTRGIHHLPVLDHDELVGVISDRDLFPVHPLHDTVVADTMSEQVLTVPTDMPIDQVIELMEDRHCGSVVVVGKDGLEGIFTTTDALRALSDVLRRTEESER